MSNRILTWAFEQKGLGPSEKIVLIKLADNSNDDGYCWPSQTKIAEHTGLKRESINRICKRLQDKGMIVIKQRFRDGAQLANHYIFPEFYDHEGGCMDIQGGVTQDHRGCDAGSQGGVTQDHTEPLYRTLIEPIPPTPLKGESEIVGEWNRLAEQSGLPKVKALTPKRKQSLKARISEHGIDGVIEAARKIHRSPHCLGKNDRGWKADFEFLLQAKSCARAREGGYDDSRKNQTEADTVVAYCLDRGVPANVLETERGHRWARNLKYLAERGKWSVMSFGPLPHDEYSDCPAELRQAFKPEISKMMETGIV